MDPSKEMIGWKRAVDVAFSKNEEQEAPKELWENVTRNYLTANEWRTYCKNYWAQNKDPDGFQVTGCNDLPRDVAVTFVLDRVSSKVNAELKSAKEMLKQCKKNAIE